jgi:hypothetical protein
MRCNCNLSKVTYISGIRLASDKRTSDLNSPFNSTSKTALGRFRSQLASNKLPPVH